MHKPMINARAQQTERNQRRHQHAKKPNFDVGDYVLRSRVDSKHQDKLLVTWIGPYQITRADSHSFTVRHLVTGEGTDVHSSRLKFYADSSLQISEEIREHVAAQGQILAINELLDYTWNSVKKGYDVLVSWKGLEPIEDSNETAKSLAKGVPALLRQFAERCDDTCFERHVIALTKQRSTADAHRPIDMFHAPRPRNSGNGKAILPQRKFAQDEDLDI
ncbi:hypothetical protein PHYSODRAFT_331951 [Phytophthora sojae]|uniref:Chromo domain-containing protein n=1 Tax=Phytophthora sojae (strain P6497) TaxID=1094619 RepID=G4ZI38_PHYSP|nr:hypothetical protein PHYSODRAFT_331951 [Phytophthora sojae]EGZ18087.1 hypothetical protein PHYSODRAFT_331951 [Phytophthora sojae]|eukprot:XP_009527145.1 hypothetical protein PHYSODRAFT_331951 [Phytophthora sojae]